MSRETKVITDTAANLGWLREAREKMHWSKKTLGFLVGISTHTVGALENGVVREARSPHLLITTLARIALWTRTLRGRVYLLEVLEECKAAGFEKGITQAILLQRLFEKPPPNQEGL